MRPGRLDRIVYVSLPDAATRSEIFKILLAKMPTSSDVDLDRLVAQSQSYSGAEIAAVVNEAAFLALEADMNCAYVSMACLERALRLVVPRTSDEMIAYFDNFSFNSSDLRRI
jgi:AAA family ATPase